MTTQTKHTPGPWLAIRPHQENDGSAMWELDDDEEPAAVYAIVAPASGEAVAMSHDLFEFREADACLIAAAPDLLEALDELLSVGITQRSWRKGRAAVAKARGEGQS